MEKLPSGSRVKIGAEKSVKVKTRDRNYTLGAALVLSGSKDKKVLSKRVGSEFTMYFPEDISEGETVCLMLYSIEDHHIGYIQDEDIYVEIDGKSYQLENRKEKTTAVILLEYYRKSENYLLRVRGDGYTFGIRAYSRKENIPLEEFITVQEEIRNPPERTYRDSWHGSSRESFRLQGSGSGVLIADNHVITNAHVVDQSRVLEIKGHDGSARAEIITMDEKHDLALLRTSSPLGSAIGLRPGRLNLGERVIAAGYPLRDILGDDLKITQGNISGLKGLGGDVSAFQFTAPIGSGSSGGAIIDHTGRLTGIVSSSLAHGELRQRGAISENMNFAVKVSTVREMLEAHDVQTNEMSPGTMEIDELVRIIKRSVISVLVG